MPNMEKESNYSLLVSSIPPNTFVIWKVDMLTSQTVDVEVKSFQRRSFHRIWALQCFQLKKLGWHAHLESSIKLCSLAHQPFGSRFARQSRNPPFERRRQSRVKLPFLQASPMALLLWDLRSRSRLQICSLCIDLRSGGAGLLVQLPVLLLAVP